MKLLEPGFMDMDAHRAEIAYVLALLAQGLSSDDVAFRLRYMDGEDIVSLLERSVPQIHFDEGEEYGAGEDDEQYEDDDEE